jgi:hypothetical protein
MERLFNSFVVAVFVIMIGAALAQAPSHNDGPLITRSIHLTLEQGHVIKEIILKDMNVAKTPSNPQVKIGAIAPDNVELLPFPATISEKVSAVASHKFFVTDDRIVIVNPTDNTIADIIE